mmetsp:Transcript_2274/g.4797  ORF Transcript_2274/g.4797 Transcript_2274/m.4797 type:complete len:84 (+) Transcript_2274:2040-2291(+)
MLRVTRFMNRDSSEEAIWTTASQGTHDVMSPLQQRKYVAPTVDLHTAAPSAPRANNISLDISVRAPRAIGAVVDIQLSGNGCS